MLTARGNQMELIDLTRCLLIVATNVDWTTEIDARNCLRSADTTTLLVPLTRWVTIGDRAFAVAAPRAWNNLPATLRDAQSLYTFRRQLKTFLFQASFPADEL